MQLMFGADPYMITSVVSVLAAGYALIRVFEACAAAYIRYKEKK